MIRRVMRGCSWDTESQFLRRLFRNSPFREYKSYVVGFRLVREKK